MPVFYTNIMKISPILANNYNQQNYKNTTSPAVKLQNPPIRDNVQFSGLYGKNLLLNILGFNPIKRMHDFSISEYQSLSADEIKLLRSQFKKLSDSPPSFYENMAEIHDFAATAMKKVFDRRFGENKYVVIPIGRSLSTIGKVLGYKIGEENVINIPLSNAKRFAIPPYSIQYRELIQNIKSNEDLETFLDFLSQHNLSRHNIETGGKNYILTDYCTSGLSLEGAETLFKSDLVWGNCKNNIFAVDFLKIFDNITFQPQKFSRTLQVEINKSDSHHIKNLLEYKLFSSKYKKFSFVERSESLSETPLAAAEQTVKNKDKKVKLVWFNLLDNEMQNRGIDKFSILTDIPKSPIRGQKIEPWHNVYSQYEYDLRNDLNEINKAIIKIEDISLQKNTNVDEVFLRKIKLNTYTIYNYLTELYKNSKTSYALYYHIRDEVIKQIKIINKDIKQL